MRVSRQSDLPARQIFLAHYEASDLRPFCLPRDFIAVQPAREGKTNRRNELKVVIEAGGNVTNRPFHFVQKSAPFDEQVLRFTSVVNVNC